MSFGIFGNKMRSTSRILSMGVYVYGLLNGYRFTMGKWGFNLFG